MTANEIWLLAGHSERDGASGNRQPALDEDGPSEYGDEGDDRNMLVDGAAGDGAAADAA